MTTSKQEREPVPPSLSRSFGALGVVAQFFARVTHWAPGGPSQRDAMVSLAQHTRQVDELAAKLRALQTQFEQTQPMLDRATTAIQRLQAVHEKVRSALEMASAINPYGSVENARARDASRAALRAVQDLQAVLAEQAEQGPVPESVQAVPAEPLQRPLRAAARRYGLVQIAWELQRTALGQGFYGNALRVAKDIQGLSDQERSLLDRYATGAHTATDHLGLQQLANFVDVMARHEALILGEGYHDRHDRHAQYHDHLEDESADPGSGPGRHQTRQRG